MFREIRKSEKITDKYEEQTTNFMKIKPETDMTYEDCENFWKEMFNAVREEFDKVREEANKQNY